MNTTVLRISALAAACTIGAHVLADGREGDTSRARQDQEVAVFVTGSLIPKRVKLRRIGTRTVSPVDIIGRTEIDQNGRATTPNAFRNEPSARVTGQ